MLISKEIENQELIHLIMTLKKKSNHHLTLVWNHLLPLSVSSRIPIVERHHRVVNSTLENVQNNGETKWTGIFLRKYSDKIHYL